MFRSQNNTDPYPKHHRRAFRRVDSITATFLLLRVGSRKGFERRDKESAEGLVEFIFGREIPREGRKEGKLDDYHSFTQTFTMPSSPRTPRHSRHPSNIDLSFASPYENESSPRRHSKISVHSPSSPNPRHSFGRSDSIGNDVFGGGGGATPSNGLGNLADELADAWDEEEGEEEEPDMNFQELREEGEGEPTRDSGVDVTSSPTRGAQPKPTNLTPPMGHRRQGSEYDGSDYGGDSDMDSPGIPPALATRMDMVESLARRGMENNGSDRDGVVKRVIDSLKDLGAQSGVEGGATRYISCPLVLPRTQY